MADDELDVLIEEDGTIRFVYSDTLADVFAGESMETKRASHVEPHPTRTGWIADMRPSGGPVLGGDGSEWCPSNDLPVDRISAADLQFVGMLDPFKTRQAALDAEREWLRRERGL